MADFQKLFLLLLLSRAFLLLGLKEGGTVHFFLDSGVVVWRERGVSLFYGP